MKKHLKSLAAVVVCSLFFIGCTKDEEMNQTSSQAENVINSANKTTSIFDSYTEAELDSMLSTYSESTLYSTFKIKQKAFFIKLGDVAGLDLEAVESEDVFTSWVGSNLDQTNFASVYEFQSAWDEVVTLNSQLVAAFPTVYEYLSEESAPYKLDKTKIWLSGHHDILVGTSSTCLLTFSNCLDNAAASYATEMERARILAYNGSNDMSNNRTYNVMALFASNAFDLRVGNCKSAFDYCMGY